MEMETAKRGARRWDLRKKGGGIKRKSRKKRANLV
jgi:hypothetical protein